MAALHPPAAGGKTAWGVGDLTSKTGEDTEELQRKRKAAAEFNDREQKRLHNLKEMDKNGGDILEARRARKANFEQGLIQGADDFKCKQLEILAKLEQNKLARMLEKKEQKDRQKAEGGGDAKKPQKKKAKKDSKKKKKKKKKDSSSSSGSDSSSDSSSGGSSSSSGKKKAKEKKDKKEVGKLIPLPDPKIAAEQQAAQKAQLVEAKHKAEEAKARQREVTRKAKEQLAAHNAQQAQKEADAAAKRESDAKKRVADVESKKTADAKARKDEEAAKKQAEEDRKNTPEAIARRKAAEDAAQSAKSGKVEKKPLNVRDAVAGGYFQGQHVKANKDITIRGVLIVRNGTSGTIVGRADTDPVNRIAVKFVPRADGQTASINCVPIEIRRG